MGVKRASAHAHGHMCVCVCAYICSYILHAKDTIDDPTGRTNGGSDRPRKVHGSRVTGADNHGHGGEGNDEHDGVEGDGGAAVRMCVWVFFCSLIRNKKKRIKKKSYTLHVYTTSPSKEKKRQNTRTKQKNTHTHRHKREPTQSLAPLWPPAPANPSTINNTTD